MGAKAATVANYVIDRLTGGNTMEMQQVRYFMAVADVLNFTRAAEMSNVSQPSLTRAIQMLESELGGPLFHRERGNTHLTELGRIMEPYLRGVAAQTEAAKKHALSYSNLELTPLKIGAMCTVGPAIIADLIIKFRSDHPGVEIIVSDCTARSLTDMLIAGDLNLALFGVPDPLDDRLHALELFEENFVVAVAPKHRLAEKEIICGADLDGEAYVNRSNCEYLQHTRAALAARGVATRQVFSSERDDWVQGMIKAELGFGFFPEFSVTDPNLVTRPMIEPAFTRRIELVTVRGRPHSPAVGAFVAEARAFMWPRRRDHAAKQGWAGRALDLLHLR